MTTIVLVASIFSPLPPKHWAGRLLLLVPTLWMVMAAIADPSRPEDPATRLIFGTTIFVTVVCLPFVAWILVSAINPEFSHLSMRSRVAIFGAVAFFAIAGWLIGNRHDIFLTCEDFEVSGNFVPKTCVKEIKDGAAASVDGRVHGPVAVLTLAEIR